MRAVDDVVVGELGIELKQMMENAGRNLAVLARLLLGGSAGGRTVAVLAGPGGNGGGGLAAARHLLGAGARVHIRLSASLERLAPVTAHQLQALIALRADVTDGIARRLPDTDLVLDALLGYAQSGPPRGDAARLIEACAGRRVLALDVPSGLELSSGVVWTPHIRAEATMTLAAPKIGLGGAGAAVVGDLYLADISVPAAAFERIGREYDTPFAESPLVRVG
jgi:NAD(P)H-hydrate epimerase